MSNKTSASDADLIQHAERHPTVISGMAQIETARLMVLKQAVRLEGTGMRHSSGKSMRKVACRELSLPMRSSCDDVIGALSKEIERRLKERQT